MMYSSIIFDLYGTLVDIRTDEKALPLWQKLARQYAMAGAAYTPAGLRLAYRAACRRASEAAARRNPEISVPEFKLEEAFASLYLRRGVTPTDALVRQSIQVFAQNSLQLLRLYDGVPALLDGLHRAGRQVYLLTNAQHALTWPQLQQLGLLPRLDGILISSDAGVAKPDPAFFRQLFTQYGIAPEHAVMVGNDHLADIAGAAAVGIPSVYIRQTISPPLPAKWQKSGPPLADASIMDGDVRRLLPLLLA